LEICKLQSSYMFKVALATTVCYDKSCINYKKLEIKTLQTNRDGIRIEAGKRAIRFEERVIERGECRILQECLKEKRKEIGKGVWKEREAYFERNGYAGAEIERMQEGGRAMTDELVQRDRDVQVQERRTRIRESR
jgi:hypothetical protein